MTMGSARLLDRTSATGDVWLEDFHKGSRQVMEELYNSYFLRVTKAVGGVLDGADQETIVHEVFYRLLTNERLRRGYRGGSFGAWISTVARNQAIDFQRRRKRETPVGAPEDLPACSASSQAVLTRIDAELMIRQFREQCLPEKWAPVFHARFIDQLDQSEAARALGMSRTTLIYQEYRVRRLLRQFFLRGDQA